MMEWTVLWRAYLDQPREVAIETLARCNAACTFCPYPTLERIGDKMPDDLIDRLIDEMATFKRPFVFSPFKVNEPFLDKRLERICNTFEEKCPTGKLRLFTNGAPLTDRNIAWVAKLTKLEHLWISLNDHRPDAYEKLMGIPFQKTAENLDRLHETDFKQKVVVSTVGGPNPEFKAYVRQRWPRFEPTIIKKDGWLGFTEPQSDLIPNEPCGRWFELSVMANGKVALCCMDGTGEYAIGDLNHSTLLEVYNAPHWRERREKLWSRHRIDPCSRCTY